MATREAASACRACLPGTHSKSLGGHVVTCCWSNFSVPINTREPKGNDQPTQEHTLSSTQHWADAFYLPNKLGELFVIHYFIELPSSQYTPHSPYCLYVLHCTRILKANHISSGPLIAVGGLQHVLESPGVSEASDG